MLIPISNNLYGFYACSISSNLSLNTPIILQSYYPICKIAAAP
jgi:hypothetical protein